MEFGGAVPEVVGIVCRIVSNQAGVYLLMPLIVVRARHEVWVLGIERPKVGTDRKYGRPKY